MCVGEGGGTGRGGGGGRKLGGTGEVRMLSDGPHLLEAVGGSGSEPLNVTVAC